jgi:maleylacetoacetate isomerase
MSSSNESSPAYQLYTYFRSTCAARIRIAAHLKGIPLTSTFIDLAAGEHNTEAFRSLNPSESVPVLVVRGPNGTESVLTQSIAILEYLEESLDPKEHTPLLPPIKKALDRAKVRELVGIVVIDIAPPTNGRIVKKVREIRGEIPDQMKFVHEVMASGRAMSRCSKIVLGGIQLEIPSLWPMCVLCLP